MTLIKNTRTFTADNLINLLSQAGTGGGSDGPKCSERTPIVTKMEVETSAIVYK